jgi:hypothetical protein
MYNGWYWISLGCGRIIIVPLATKRIIVPRDCHCEESKFESELPRGLPFVANRGKLESQGVIPVVTNRGIGPWFATKE